MKQVSNSDLDVQKENDFIGNQNNVKFETTLNIATKYCDKEQQTSDIQGDLLFGGLTYIYIYKQEPSILPPLLVGIRVSPSPPKTQPGMVLMLPRHNILRSPKFNSR